MTASTPAPGTRPTRPRRITPSFVLATLALVVASGGAGYAAGQVTSAQIKDGTIQSRDVADGSLGGADLRDRSITRDKLDRGCEAGYSAVSGGCVRHVGYPAKPYERAVKRCWALGGRLPTVQELQFIAGDERFRWANGDSYNYEFTSDTTSVDPLTPLAIRQVPGYPLTNASAQYFWHHCVVF